MSRHRRLDLGDVIAALALLVVALLVANAAKSGFLSEEFFKNHKDTIDGGGKILAGTLFAAGAVVSYFRFFKGRTFASRADLSVTVDVMPGRPGTNLHVISVELHNLGALPIWEPVVRLRVHPVGDPPVESFDITNWQAESLLATSDGRVAVVDSQETALFSAERYFQKELWAVRYEASVESRRGDAWNSIKTVSNVLADTAKTAERQAGGHGSDGADVNV